MNTRFFKTAGAMVALLFLWPAAHAATATAELDFKFEFIDLDPNDGVTPSMTVGWRSTGGSVTGTSAIDVGSDGTSIKHYQQDNVNVLATWNYQNGRFVSSASSANLSSGRVESEVLFNAENPGTPSSGNCCLTVSYGAALRITGTAKVNVSGGEGMARTGFIIYDSGDTYAYKQAEVYSPGSQELDLSTTWVSNGRSNISFAIWTYAAAMPSPVPEPSALALMALGGAALAWRLRHRPRTAQPSEA